MQTTVQDGVLHAVAADGSTAVCVPLVAGVGTDVETFVAHCQQVPPVVLLLLRRGGYAVGLVEGGRLAVSKCGTRYVQSRTAAGGWSQQRFARRRDNQAAGLVDVAAATVSRILLGEDGRAAPRDAVVVTGGDRALLDDLLADRRLAVLAALPRARHLEVPDPRSDVLKAAALRAASVLVTVRNA